MDKTVVKAFRMLELLALADAPTGVTRLAEQTGLQKSNVHRLLSTLCYLGYARRDEAAAYEPTLRLWEMGQHVYSRLGVAGAARPLLKKLMEQTGESAHLAIFDRIDIVYLDRVETPNPVRAYTAIGGRGPAYCTASGKALLAYQPAETVRAVADAIQRQTAETIATFAALTKELAGVRAVGYATNLGEFRDNVAGLAAPVRLGNGEAIAAVGISGPLDRLRLRRLKSLAPAVMTAAAGVARTMGVAGRNRG